MKTSGVQRLLAASGYYKGGIDGQPGPKTMTGVDKVLVRNKPEAQSWSVKRRLIAAAQIILNAAGFEAGAVDGYLGHNTRNAYEAWDYHAIHGKREVIARVPEPAPRPARQNPKFVFPRQKDVAAFYGRPGSQVQRQLVNLQPAYGMKIDYAMHQNVRTLRLHEKCSDSADQALTEIVRHYGQDRLNELGLNRYAGAYNHRRMRGGKSWSMHAYGCAIDFYARPNGLRLRCPDALFCKPEYTAFFDIWEENGWTSLGRAIGRDWMHVQAASL